MHDNDQSRDTCLWPLDACLKHDAATKQANGCPREPERWAACLGDKPALALEPTALALIERGDEVERAG